MIAALRSLVFLDQVQYMGGRRQLLVIDFLLSIYRCLSQKIHARPGCGEARYGWKLFRFLSDKILSSKRYSEEF